MINIIHNNAVHVLTPEKLVMKSCYMKKRFDLDLLYLRYRLHGPTFYLKYQPQQIERFYYTREQKLSIDIHPTKCTKSTVCLPICLCAQLCLSLSVDNKSRMTVCDRSVKIDILYNRH